MKLILLSFTLITFININSCTKDKRNVMSGNDCPQSIIDKIKQEPVRNPPAEVYRYNIRNTTYYYVTSYCCDMMSELYDANCKRICSPDGGFSGHGDGTCPPDLSSIDSSTRELIWKDGRR